VKLIEIHLLQSVVC